MNQPTPQDVAAHEFKPHPPEFTKDTCWECNLPASAPVHRAEPGTPEPPERIWINPDWQDSTEYYLQPNERSVEYVRISVPGSDGAEEAARNLQTELNDAVMYCLREGCFFPVPEPKPGASTQELIQWGAMRHLHDAIARFNREESATPSAPVEQVGAAEVKRALRDMTVLLLQGDNGAAREIACTLNLDLIFAESLPETADKGK